MKPTFSNLLNAGTQTVYSGAGLRTQQAGSFFFVVVWRETAKNIFPVCALAD
jgi:single-stranded DNA-binding protein